MNLTAYGVVVTLLLCRCNGIVVVSISRGSVPVACKSAEGVKRDWESRLWRRFDELEPVLPRRRSVKSVGNLDGPETGFLCIRHLSTAMRAGIPPQ
jgi:hypothetical protein